jgi:VWFA-related protein
MRSGRTIRRGGLAAALLGCGAAVAAWGQPPPAPTQPSFSSTTQVLSIDVPVQVVRDGEPVRGLRAADFQVWEGRRRLAITGFESLDLTAPGPSSGKTAGVPAAARRHFLFLFDLAFSEPRSIAQARQAAAGLLPQLHPTDLVAVATYSSRRGPQLVLGYTADRRQIDNALASLGLPGPTHAIDPLRLVLQEMLGVGNTVAGVRPLSRDPLADAVDAATLAPSVAQGIVEADRAALKAQVDLFARSLSDLARQMAVVEGRKYLVFLSEGFDAELLRGVAGLDRQGEMRESVLAGESWRVSSEERYGLTETANAVERMVEEFRRADCTIQAVDIGGLRAGADQGPPRVGGRDSLLVMTRGTGGELYESFNDLGVAMSQMLRRTSVTYVLAVEPEKGADGGYRRLRVALNAPLRGARLVHRPGYYPPKPYAEEDPIEKLLAAANQVMSGEESDGVGAAVLAAPFRSAGEKAYVPVLIEVDGPSLLAGPQPAALPVEIYAYALDEGGAVHDFFTRTVGLDLAKVGSPLRQSGLHLFGHLDLLPGDYSLRVLVRNGASGVSGLKVLPLHVPAFNQGEPFLLPLLLPAASNALLVHEEPRGEGAPPPNPFLLRDQPFVPAVHPALAPGREVRVVLAGYNLGAGPWKGVATVVAADGREIPGGYLAISSRLDGGAGGPDRAVATFRLPAGLAPGDYELRITLAGDAPRTSSLRFSVPRGPA